MNCAYLINDINYEKHHHQNQAIEDYEDVGCLGATEHKTG